MKCKTTIPELLRKAGKWWGGEAPVVAWTTGWVTRNDWMEPIPHQHRWYKIREGSREASLLGPKS